MAGFDDDVELSVNEAGGEQGRKQVELARGLWHDEQHAGGSVQEGIAKAEHLRLRVLNQQLFVCCDFVALDAARQPLVLRGRGIAQAVGDDRAELTVVERLRCAWRREWRIRQTRSARE